MDTTNKAEKSGDRWDKDNRNYNVAFKIGKKVKMLDTWGYVGQSLKSWLAIETRQAPAIKKNIKCQNKKPSLAH
jgi:hypothetical protein